MPRDQRRNNRQPGNPVEDRLPLQNRVGLDVNGVVVRPIVNLLRPGLIMPLCVNDHKLREYSRHQRVPLLLSILADVDLGYFATYHQESAVAVGCCQWLRHRAFKHAELT